MTNNKQQTGVQWFAFELSKLGLLPDGVPDDIYKQAKEMEKEQMKKTASYWQKMGILVATKIPNRKTFEQWFSETYGGSK
jgi:hypothetical protein